MTRFLFALIVLVLMSCYQAIVTLLASHVVGVEIPPVLTLVLLAISPMLLLLANGLPSLYSLLPGADGTVPLPLVGVSAATVELATHTLREAAAAERSELTPAVLVASPPAPTSQAGGS